jgi:carboxylate-amine ligase
MGTMVSSGVIRSVKEVWWDVRPHPEFGTVELRMCDASPTFREVAALAALAQCLVADAVARFDAGELPPPPRPWTTRENRWLASRHGVNADLIATPDGRRQPGELLLEQLVERLRPMADDLGCRSELDDTLEIWASRPSYLRQRHIVEAGGSLHDVTTHLVDELADDEVRAAVPLDLDEAARRPA